MNARSFALLVVVVLLLSGGSLSAMTNGEWLAVRYVTALNNAARYPERAAEFHREAADIVEFGAVVGPEILRDRFLGVELEFYLARLPRPVEPPMRGPCAPAVPASRNDRTADLPPQRRRAPLSWKLPTEPWR